MRLLLRLAPILPLLLSATAAAPAPPATRPAASAPAASLYEAPWRWTDERGATVTLASWRGRTVLVVPFYASCRVRCPLTIDKVRSVEAAYRQAGKLVAVVLVTLDPSADTPSRLLRFKKTAALPDSWTLLGGSLADTRALARVLDVRPTADDMHIDHQVRIAVLDRDGRLARNLHGWDFASTDAVLP